MRLNQVGLKHLAWPRCVADALLALVSVLQLLESELVLAFLQQGLLLALRLDHKYLFVIDVPGVSCRSDGERPFPSVLRNEKESSLSSVDSGERLRFSPGILKNVSSKATKLVH